MENFKYNRKTIRFFHPIAKFAKYLGLLPWYDLKTNTWLARRFYIYQSMILSVVVTVLMVLNIINAYHHGQHFILYSFFGKFITFQGHIGILNMIWGVYLKRNQWAQFIEDFYTIENLCDTSRTEYEFNILNNGFFQFICFNISFFTCLLVLLLPWYIQIVLGKAPLVPVLCHTELYLLVFYYVNMSIFIRANLLSAIRHKYDHLILMVRRVKIKDEPENTFLFNIKNIDFVFYHLYQIVAGFNNIFKDQNYGTLVFGFFSMLWYCFYLINYQYQYTDVVLVIVYLTPSLVCIYACDLTKRSHEKLISTCLKVQQCFPESSIHFHELKFLSFKVKALNKGFSAAGYFDINRTVLLSMCGAVSTYFIAIQEIWKSRMDPNN